MLTWLFRLGSFGNTTEQILNATTYDLFEAVQVYKLKGQSKWLMIVECIGSVGRYFRSFTTTDLAGNFTELSGLESNPFAGKANTQITWSDDISHGDLIRSTNDQTQEIDPCNLQFLFQGRANSTAGYNDLPYRPGLLNLLNPGPKVYPSSITTIKTRTTKTSSTSQSAWHSTSRSTADTKTKITKTKAPETKTKTTNTRSNHSVTTVTETVTVTNSASCSPA